MRNADTDEPVRVYKDHAYIVIATPDVGEIALTHADANELANVLLSMTEE